MRRKNEREGEGQCETRQCVGVRKEKKEGQMS